MVQRYRQERPLAATAASFYHRQLMSSTEPDAILLPVEMYVKQDSQQSTQQGPVSHPPATTNKEEIHFTHPFLPSSPSPLSSSTSTSVVSLAQASSSHRGPDPAISATCYSEGAAPFDTAPFGRSQHVLSTGHRHDYLSVSPLHSRRSSFTVLPAPGNPTSQAVGKTPVHHVEAQGIPQTRSESQDGLAADANQHFAPRSASLALPMPAFSSIPMLLQREHVVYQDLDLRSPPPSFEKLHSMVLAKLPATQEPSASAGISTTWGKKQANFLKKRQHSVPHDHVSELLGPADSTSSADMNVRINILDECIQSSVSGLIILESRRATWRKFCKLSKDENVDIDELRGKQQKVALSSASVLSGNAATTDDVDPWDLPIDAASILESGATRGTRTFEFPELRTVTLCPSCSGSCKMSCGRCGGLEAGECFWCSGSGRFRGHKCTKCAQSGTLQCPKCHNTGKVECGTCDGKGALKMALCVDVKLRPIELPAMPLMDEGAEIEQWNQMLSDHGFVQLKATQAVFETAQRLYDQIAQQPSLTQQGKPAEKRVPVMAQCVCKRWIERTIGVTRYIDTLSRSGDGSLGLGLPRANSVPSVQQHYRFRLSSLPESELVPTNYGGSRSRSSSKPGSQAVSSTPSSSSSSSHIPTPALLSPLASVSTTPNLSPQSGSENGAIPETPLTPPEPDSGSTTRSSGSSNSDSSVADPPPPEPRALEALVKSADGLQPPALELPMTRNRSSFSKLFRGVDVRMARKSVS